MTQAELDKIIENHQHWLRKGCDGWQDMRACIHGENLSGLDFSYSNLVKCNITGCDLSESNLLRSNFSYSDLSESNLLRSNFLYSDLSRCNLSRCDFSYSNLSRCDFSYSNLSRCDLTEAINIPFIPTVCPEKGSFIGFKKARRLKEMFVIVKLLIPEDAKRSSGLGRKCRCDKAKVLSIMSVDGREPYKTACSIYDRHFIYEVGKEVSVSDFCEDRFNECAAGIHFFINREEAVRY